MKRRLFEQIRVLILLALSNGQSTINKISNDTGINWKTVQNHLTFLLGKSYVKEIFSSQYVRIFEITPHGRDYAKKFLQNEKKCSFYTNHSNQSINENVCQIIGDTECEKEEILK